MNKIISFLVGILYIYIKVYFVKSYWIDISADLGTSSNYKRVKLLDWRGKGFHMKSNSIWVSRA